MASPHTQPVVVGVHPIYSWLLPFASVPFFLVFVSDIVYWRTVNLFWQHASEWLLLAATFMGGVTLVIGLLEMLFRRSVRAQAPGFVATLFFVAAYVVGFVNNLVHARDGWTGVVFLGLGLSGATVVLLVLSALTRRAPIERREFGAIHA